MTSVPKMAALIHNDGMAPTIAAGSIAVAEYPEVKVERWQIIAYRSQLTLDQAVHIACRDSLHFAALGESKVREFYSAHFRVFGALRINRVGRVVGLSNETVGLRSDGVYIDGQKASLPSEIASLYSAIPGAEASVVVPENQIFILQDNLERGNDSRTLGTVKLTSVLGTLSDLLSPGEVTQLFSNMSSRVPADILADLEEQHGPASSWVRAN